MKTLNICLERDRRVGMYPDELKACAQFVRNAAFLFQIARGANQAAVDRQRGDVSLLVRKQPLRFGKRQRSPAQFAKSRSSDLALERLSCQVTFAAPRGFGEPVERPLRFLVEANCQDGHANETL
jgi:hypothetical protein